MRKKTSECAVGGGDGEARASHVGGGRVPFLPLLRPPERCLAECRTKPALAALGDAVMRDRWGGMGVMGGGSLCPDPTLVRWRCG